MKIELYINGQLADLQEDPHIEFTWQTTDYSEPTVVKNSFTKTITLPSTPNNDRIFNHINIPTRTQPSGKFNPSQRSPFVLNKDGVLVEKGYAKLDNITKEGNTALYQITLYGGLSQFLFGLSYDPDGNKRGLSGLSFLGGGDDELDFKISKEIVKEAWDSLSSDSPKDIWEIVNFAVCYEGYPEGFSADKCVVNTNQAGYQVRQALPDGLTNQVIATAVTSGGTTYKATEGYIYGELNTERTSLEMRDLRSYLQRPVIRCKALINAICNPANNGGYEVSLDPKFFTEENPYWERSWLTLPLLTGLDSEAVTEDYGWDLGSSVTTNAYDTYWNITEKTIVTSDVSSYRLSFSLSATIASSAEKSLYLSAGDSLGGIAVQIIGLDGSGNAVCGSSVALLTNRSSKGAVYDYNRLVNDNTYVPMYSAGVSTILGSFERVTENEYKWSNNITLTMDTTEESPESLRIRVTYLPYLIGGTWHSGPRRKYVYPSISDDSTHYTATVSVTDRQGKVSYDGGEGNTHTGTLITKRMLLSGLEGTPAEWLLSFTKKFGLYIVKDRLEDKISILTRSSYYNGGETDIEEMIDRSREARIDPLTFDTKFLTLYGAEKRDSVEKESEYKDTWGSDYGIQTVDTGYNFNTDSSEIMSKCKDTPGVTVLEKSPWFTEMRDGSGNSIPSVFHNWVTLKYTSGEDELEVNTGYPLTAEDSFLDSSYTTFYDIHPKLQLHSKNNAHVERVGTMVFLNAEGAVTNMNLWLTDDTTVMYRLNDREPCWLVTSSENDLKGNKIAVKLDTIPLFSRLTQDTGVIGMAMDYGRTKELYIPNKVYSKGDVTIYERYWKKYMQDLYSVNTRTLECHLAGNGLHINQDWLRRFYYFDNCCWVMTKIDSMDISSSEPVKCLFTKVNDKEAYTPEDSYQDVDFRVSRGDGKTDVPAATDLNAMFYVYSDGDWSASIGEGASFVSFDMSSPYVTSAVGVPNKQRRVRIIFTENKGDTGRRTRIDFVRTDGLRKSMWVTQKGAGQYTPYLTVEPNPVQAPMNAEGWSTTIEVKSTSPWTNMRPGSSGWATLTPDSGTAGTTVVTITAESNDTGEDRTSVNRLLNDEGIRLFFRVNQQGTANATLTRIDKGLEIPASGGTAMYQVNANTPWTLEIDGDWKDDSSKAWSWANSYAVPDILSGNSDAVITVAYKVNNSTLTRVPRFHIVFLTVMSQHVSVYEATSDYGVQKGKQSDRPPMPPTPGDEDNPTPVDPGGSGYTSWEAWTDDSWIHLKTPTSGTGEADVAYWLDKNTGNQRKGYIYIKYTYEDKSTRTETIEITQEGDSQTNPLTVTPTVVNASWNDKNIYQITVDAPADWTATATEDWVTIIKGDSGFGVTVVSNDSEDARTGTITVVCGDESVAVTVNQSAGVEATYLTVSPKEITFTDAGGTAVIRVSSNQPWTVA